MIAIVSKAKITSFIGAIWTYRFPLIAMGMTTGMVMLYVLFVVGLRAMRMAVAVAVVTVIVVVIMVMNCFVRLTTF